jgi:hypothetical protein
MINPVTPWTATVQADIADSILIKEILVSQYNLQIWNAGDSIWLTVKWPDSGSIAFRLAFGMNSEFEKVESTEGKEGVLIKGTTRLGRYKIAVSFPKDDQPLFRYTTTFKASYPLLIPFWPRDIVPLTKDGEIQNTLGTVHMHQAGTRSGILYFSMTKPHNGTVFYFQNLTAMSPYCDVTETTLAESVGGDWPEIGFQFPVNKTKPLPAHTEYTISDAFVLLDDVVVKDDAEVTIGFLNKLATIYPLLRLPQPVYQDWLTIAKDTLSDLKDNKACWSMIGDTAFLNAYAGDYKTPAEIMVQLAVLLPLHEYLTWSGEEHPLYDDLRKGLSDFYDERVKSIVRWHPERVGSLDQSEEQKEDMVMDSWYLHHPLLNLCRLALRGDKFAGELFMKSVDFAIKVAHEYEYNWPVFYKMTTLEIIKKETSPGKGGEKDVPGSYAHVMLMAYKLTGEKRFIKEAVRALKSLENLAFDIFYQANNTAFTAGALVELYRETQNEVYLNLSYSCLAGLFKNVQLWECNYGYGKYFPTFFSVFPLKDAPYTAAYEEFEVFAALHHYMEVADGLDILPSLKILIPEFIKYAVGRLPFYYPSMLPEDMIAEEIKTGEVQKKLWIPLEDIHDGWEKSGEVGQEVYGAGMAFGVIPRQYFMLKEADIMGFTNYPALKFRYGKNKVTFQFAGDADFRASIKLSGLTNSKVRKIKIEAKTTGAYKEVTGEKPTEFEVPGNAQVRISW